MKNGVKAFTILVLLLGAVHVALLPLSLVQGHSFSIAVIAQVFLLLVVKAIIKSHRSSGESRESFLESSLNHALIFSTAALPLVIAGGFFQTHALTFISLALLGSIIHGSQSRAFFGLALVCGVDVFLVFQAQLNLIPGLDSPYSVDKLPFSSLYENIALSMVLFVLSLTTRAISTSQVLAKDTALKSSNEEPTSVVGQSTSQSTSQTKGVSSGASTTQVGQSSSSSSINPAGSVQALTRKDELKLDNLEGVLESIVFFLSKNFKSLTATGFLSQDGGRTFNLNACFSKKDKYINHDAVVHIGQGLIGSAALKENGFMSGDLRSYPEKIEYYGETPDVNSLMAVRITNANGRIIGMLSVDSSSTRAFDDDDKDLMFRFSKVASMLISNVKMSAELTENSRTAELSYGLTKMMSEQFKPNDVLKILMLNLGKLFNSKRQVLCDVSAATGQGRILHIAGDPGSLKKGMSFGLSNASSVYGKAFRSGKTELFENFGEDHFRFQNYQEHDDVDKVLLAPILDERSKPIAIIGVEFGAEHSFKETDRNLLNTICLNASSALTKAKIFQKMEKQATIDGLTQIPNHRHFQDLMDMEMERATRENGVVSLLLMDIDHFKKFNDTYGHPVGDLVLKMVSKALQGAVRKTDHIARYGGEEFVVILPQAEGEVGRQSAERVRQAIEAIDIPHESGTLKVTMSIGMCTYPTLSKTKAELIEFSDQALYHSKENGRNCVSLYEEIQK